MSRSPHSRIAQPVLPAPSVSPPRAASVSELEELELEPRIGRYQARDARWAHGQPLLVGSDYDFALAAALPVEGPGVAAYQRAQANLTLADELSVTRAPPPEALLRALLRHCDGACAALRGPKKFWIYGILYGRPTARLRVVVEYSAGDGKRTQLVAVGPSRPIRDFVDAARLAAEFDAGLARVARGAGLAGVEPAATAATERCSVGGKASVRGAVVARDEATGVVLRLGQGISGLLDCGPHTLAGDEPAVPRPEPDD